MLSVSPERRIWLCTQPTDMRRSFDGLSALVRNHLGEDPGSGHWYAFINRRRTQMKVLAYEEAQRRGYGDKKAKKALQKGSVIEQDLIDYPLLNQRDRVLCW